MQTPLAAVLRAARPNRRGRPHRGESRAATPEAEPFGARFEIQPNYQYGAGGAIASGETTDAAAKGRLRLVIDARRRRRNGSRSAETVMFGALLASGMLRRDSHRSCRLAAS